MARQFRFRLESVLDLRSRESNDAQAQLGLAIANLHNKESELADRKRYRAELIGAGKGGTSVAELEAHWYHARCIDAEIREIEEQCSQLRSVENECREHLRDAMQKRRSLERLRDRRVEEHKDQERRSEQENMDEIAGRAAAAHLRGPKHG